MSAASVDGLLTRAASQGPAETLTRLRSEIAARSLTIFAEIDHAAAAAAVGLTLRPLFLLIFGAAKGGTPLMQAAATAGIDLPLKILVWQDEAGETLVSYNDPTWLAKRHGVGEIAPVQAMSAMLQAVVAAAAA